MRTGLLLLILLSALSFFSANAEIYRWTDANGNTVFGDSPPKTVKAKPIDLPLLTVADSFNKKEEEKQAENGQEETSAYSAFHITAPTDGESIRSNEGSLNVSLSLKPQLQDGDEVTLYVDAKQVATGKTLTFTLSELDRGEHTVFAVLTDAEGNIILNTDPVTFNLLRYSAL